MERDLLKTRFCSVDDLSDEIRKKLFSVPEHLHIENDAVYLLMGDTVFLLENNPAGKALAYAVNQKQKKRTGLPRNEIELFERIMADPEYQPDPSLIRQYGINIQRPRCAAVFRSYTPLDTDLCTILKSMAPAEDGDLIIPEDYQTAVFIKNPGCQTEDEISEFFEAVIGTMESEGIDDIRVGIGGTYTAVEGLRKSCQEGFQALQLGIKYHCEDHVYIFSGQMLERIVDSIPEEKRNNLLETCFGSESLNTLSEELLETVRVFFRNDLNLTAASKQLFIHRNTLNYRLDKIKKDFGLDLRVFRDAVIFRIITEIANEKKR